MAMSKDRSQRERRIAKALDSVRAAGKARGWYNQFEDGHRLKTPENDDTTRLVLEDTIRSAMGYGYPVEAVAVAASITVEEVAEIVDGSAAA